MNDNESSDTTRVVTDQFKHNFTGDQAEQISELINDFASIFDTPRLMRTTTSVKHEIKLETEKPIYVKPYQYSIHKQKIIKEEVREMLDE